MPYSERSWTKQKERSSKFWLRLIRGIALKLPRFAVLPLLYPITLFFVLISKSQVAASRHYLGQVFDRPVGFTDVFRHFLWFATTILDRVYFLTGRTHTFALQFDNPPNWAESIIRQPPQLFLGAHFGSFDAIRALSAQRLSLKIKIVLKVDQNQNLVKLLNDLNPALAENIIASEGMGTVFAMHEALQQGQSVAMLKDRAVGDEATVSVRFFDDTIAVPVSGFKLAKRFKLPVNVFFGRFDGGNRYTIINRQLDYTVDTPIEEMAQAYMDMVAEQCRVSPYNWFNFFQYWQQSGEAE